jgi:DNA-binding response OmpR family regulator
MLWREADAVHILIVEDEPRIRDFLTRAFRAEGFTATAVADGNAGVHQATAGEYDLVVLDLLLPGLNGLEALSEIRRHQPDLPVLILSARADLATRLRGFELGAVDYLAKPFSLDELLARARVHLRRAHSIDRSLVISVGALALDQSSRQAQLGDRVVDLSDREFQLLRYLLTHVGEVVSRERLLSEVWGYDFDPRSNVVDVCVRRIRRRLGSSGPIETIRNVGYRVAA